jgi:hypothetical protein
MAYRKCLILFNWLGPLSIITAPQSLPLSSTKGRVQEQPLLHKLLHASPPVLLDLICGISDDAATCYKLGLLPDRIGVQAEKMADWCWFASTLVGLVEVGVEDGIISGAIRDSTSMTSKATALHIHLLAPTSSRKPSLQREYDWTRNGFGIWPSN